MQRLLQDVRHALRMFRESPGFTATIIAALALAIGVNTAIFSVVNAVLFKPLPYSHPDTLVAVENTSHGRAYGPWASPVKYTHWRAQTDAFSDVAAIELYPRYLNYTGGDTPEQVTVSRVSESYFRVLGAPIVRGRPFTAVEDRPGGPKVAVISYSFWQRQLGGAKDVLGKTLALSGGSYTIVGILGQGFDADPYFGVASYGDADVLIPFQISPNTTDQANEFANLARLAPGVTLAEAQSRVAASEAAFRRRFPASLPKTDGFTVLRAQQAMTDMFGDPRTRLWVLLGAVGFVLLIACANVANLLLVRATGRAQEIAIRSALGAGRGRIMRLLLTEGVLLSLAGGGLGLVVGFLGIRALLAVNTARLPRLGPGGALVSMDWRVAAFTLGIALATGLVFGLAPALVASRTDLNSVIKGSGNLSGRGVRQRSKTRSALVTVEIALTVVLLIGAALLIRTSIALGRVKLGFDPAHVVVMHTTFSGARFRSAQNVAQTIRTGLERVRSLPGVKSAAVTTHLPTQGSSDMLFDIVGKRGGKGSWTGHADTVEISGSYFSALGIPVISGRGFTGRDDADGPPVAIVNRAMAKRYWAHGRDPLGDRIQIALGFKPPGTQLQRRIVGIVGNAHYAGLDKKSAPVIYVPVAQDTSTAATLSQQIARPAPWVIRTRDDSATLTASIRNAIRDATGLAVVNVEPMERVLSASVSYQRLNMLLMSIFGGAALLLAAIGIYGLLAYSVQQRAQEIGIRMALGADAERVKVMVVRQGMTLVAIGTAAGLVGAFYTARVLASWLFEVKPRDPIVFITVPVILALIALVSVWLPARRASRVDPMVALRYE